MTLVNLHNHTARCGHATGTMDQYIEAALEKGISIFGFSDHAPLPPPLCEGITMAPGETEEYLTDIFNARQKWKNRCRILAGFEVDFPLFETFDRAYLTDPRIDYLIGSCHFLGDWPFDHDDYIDEFSKRDINEIYRQYLAILEDLADARLFNIMGHFDLIKKFGHRATSDMSNEIRSVARKAAAAGMAVEINTSGLIKPVKEIYPSENIVRILFEENVPVTLGSDSHAPEHVGQAFDEAAALLNKCGYDSICYFEKRRRRNVKLET